MLVLSRKKDQRIVIAGGEIVLTVVEIRGDSVRLGVEAARDIPIHRGEVQEAIDAAIIAAGATDARQ
jgi:carbon storage regulator